MRDGSPPAMYGAGQGLERKGCLLASLTGEAEQAREGGTEMMGLEGGSEDNPVVSFHNLDPQGNF